MATSRSTLVVNSRELDRMLNGTGGAVYRHLVRRSQAIIIAAKRQVGVDTGTLRASIHMRHSRRPNGHQMWIGSTDPIALIHHNGTRPHIIAASRQPVMRFSASGRMVYTRTVRHPGTRANRYLSDNLFYAHL